MVTVPHPKTSEVGGTIDACVVGESRQATSTWAGIAMTDKKMGLTGVPALAGVYFKEVRERASPMRELLSHGSLPGSPAIPSVRYRNHHRRSLPGQSFRQEIRHGEIAFARVVVEAEHT